MADGAGKGWKQPGNAKQFRDAHDQIFSEDEPIVFPDTAPSVAMEYACGRQVFIGKDLRCGMMVAPAPSERGDGMIVHITGSPRDVLHMILAAIDSSDGFGVRDALKVCIAQDAGMDEVSEVLGEEWYT